MPYERDADIVTRGVGAIAAADHGSPARYRHRVQVGRALRKRDRVMSAIAQGALGMVIAGDPPGGSRGSNNSSIRLRLPTRPITAVAVMPGGPVNTALPLPVSVTAPPAPTPIPAPVPAPVSAPMPAAPVVPIAPAPASQVRVAPVTISGGGGGVPLTTAVMSPPIIGPSVSLPDVPDGARDHTTRNVILLAAGAGALAYFLFFRGKR